MKIFPAVGDYFALDIGTTSVRALQLSGNDRKGWTMDHYGVAPIDIRVSSSDSEQDRQRLSEVITTVIGQSGIRSKNVILGVPSNKMFATVVDMPQMPKNELNSTIKYQIEQYIPMSIDEAKVDWAVLGKSPNDQTKNEVLLSSVGNKFLEARLDLVEGLGLNVIAMEPDSLALTRALLPHGMSDARLLVEVGDFATDIVMTYDNAPRLIRSIPNGFQTLVKTTAQNLNVEHKQAEQFITKFGLQPDKLEGQVLKAMESSISQFTSEIDKSLKFFKTKYPNVNIGGMIVSNYGVTVPGLAQHLGQSVGLSADSGNPWQRVRVNSSDQTKLQPLSSQFAVPIGLAQRGNV